MINAKEARNLTHKNISFAIGEATEDTQRNIQRKIQEAIDRYESETGLEFINRYTDRKYISEWLEELGYKYKWYKPKHKNCPALRIRW